MSIDIKNFKTICTNIIIATIVRVKYTDRFSLTLECSRQDDQCVGHQQTALPTKLLGHEACTQTADHTADTEYRHRNGPYQCHLCLVRWLAVVSAGYHTANPFFDQLKRYGKKSHPAFSKMYNIL